MWPYKKTLLSFLICVFSASSQVTNSAVLPQAESRRIATSNIEGFRQNIPCGNWAWDFPTNLQDPRLILEQNDLIDSGTECRTEISLINNTGIPVNINNIISTDVLSYSLELSIRTENARIEWKYPYDRPTDHYFAFQSLNATFGAIPLDPGQKATIYIEGRQTTDSLANDVALFLTYKLIDWYPCIPVHEAIYSAINISNRGVFHNALQLYRDHKYVEAYREMSSAVIEFYNTFLMEGRAKCAGDISEKIMKRVIGDLPSTLLEITYYSTHVTADYIFRYQGSPAKLTIGYQPAQPPLPISPSLDKNDLSSVMQWMAYSMKHKEATRITALIGSSGTVFAPYGIGAQPKGYNNSDEILTALEAALRISEPICLGYDPNFGTSPDKAIIYFQGINFDQAGTGVTNEQNVTGFQFFKLQDGWELIFITPIPEWGLPDYQSLTPCPGETSNSLTPTPASNANSSADLTDPISVVAAINRGLHNRDISVFQSLITTNTRIAAYGGQGIDPKGQWQCPTEGIEPYCYLSPADFLSEMPMHLNGTFACQYWYSATNGLLFLEVRGWNPVWKWPNGESDTLQFSLQRREDNNPQSPFEMNQIDMQPMIGPGFYDTICP